MRGDLEHSLEVRIDRYLEVEHQGIIANHHFAPASSECIDLYRDGYELSAVMVSQAVTEGIWQFVLERNQINYERDREAQAAALVAQGIISAQCSEAFGRIWRSFRNDVHHMNPSVATVPFRGESLVGICWTWLRSSAKSLRLRSATEGWLPVRRLYWDLQADGTTSVFLRNPWMAG